MKRDLVIAIDGTDTFLGAALEARLRAAGHTVLPLPREVGLLPGCDVLIQLGDGDLVSKLPDAVALPKVFIYGSSTDYYGHRPGEPLDEASPPARGPRAGAEADARRAETLGIRTVILRFGEILDPSGGYLGRMLPLMRHGVCFVMGHPEDRFAWISLEDALRLIEFAMRNDRVRGAMNAVAPVAATQGAFARAAAAIARRRLLGTLRSRFLRTRLGVLADIQDVAPARALQEGFGFVHPTLQFWRSHESRTA
jgi:NAD dependent epimerase/dehydratase family enzyme